MKTHKGFGVRAIAIALGIFIGMLIFMEAGRQIGLRDLAAHGQASRSAIGVIDGAIFALVSLLVGFTFNGAAGRFDSRRKLVSNQINAASTAWQRVDLLPESLQGNVRRAFLHYVDQLLASYRPPHSHGDPWAATPELTAAESDLWLQTVKACTDNAGEKARVLLIPTINEMLGAVEMERLARRIHPPRAIYGMLAIMMFAASLFGGYSMAGGVRNWLHIIGVSAALSLALYVILDLEYPRRGFIQIEDMDRALVDLRDSMRWTPQVTSKSSAA